MKSISEIRSLKRVFILLVISLTVSVGAAFLYIYNDSQRDRINDLKYTAKVIKSYYELSFHQWELSLLSLGNRLVEIEDPQERLDYANQALEVYENELLAFGLADPSGQVLTFTGRPVNDSMPNLAASDRTKRSFKLALERRGLILGESYYFENVSDWILPMRVPIYDSQDNLVAVNTSAVDYSSMIKELDEFGFDPHYQVHLINNDFGTNQLVYPLDRDVYESVLGSSSFTYGDPDTLQSFSDTHLISSIDPAVDSKVLCVSTSIDLVNHQLVVSVSQKFLLLEFLDRFKYVFLVYVVLLIAAIFLYKYMKKNLTKSILSLRSERANLKSIIESTSNIIGLFDTNKRLVEFNQAFNLISKATDGFVLEQGTNVLAKMKHKDRAMLFEQFLNRALSGEKFQEETTYPGPEGDLIFRFTYNPVYSTEEIVGVAFFAEDITEIRGYQQKLESYNKDLELEVEERTKELQGKNKELEHGYSKLQSTQQQLIRAEKMASLGILSAGIGHEINNPLNFIKHGSISLKDQLAKDHQGFNYDDYFFAIEEGVRRASTIVSGLSHFSRAGEDMSESCDIHQILDNSLTLLNSRLKSKDIKVFKEFDAERVAIIGNEGKLHQVFTNIINNAEQAIAEKGEIRIRTSNRNDKIIVEVEDTGMGMSKDIIKKMLDPFFTTKEPGEGTGLGMFICEMIMEEHNAEMDVSSVKGEGTTFTLTFMVD